MINNIDLHKSYNILSNIFNGATTYKDSIILLNKLDLPDNERTLAQNIIQSKKFNNCIDSSSLLRYMIDINNCNYREEATLKLNSILRETSDISQIKTLTRIVNTKPIRPIDFIKNNIYNKKDLILKACPHCKKEYKLPKNVNYIICGHDDNHYDWDGCGLDWCFTCNKLLCKNWEEDSLFHPANQIHDGKCCKNHAERTGNTYPDDYCQCSNKHINRNVFIDIFA
jgi:hypothetical protein